MDIRTFIGNELQPSIKLLNCKRLRLFLLNTILVIIFSLLYLKVAFYVRDAFDLNSRAIRYLAVPLIYLFYTYFRKKKKTFSEIYSDFVIKNVLLNYYPNWKLNKDILIDSSFILDTDLVKKGEYFDISNNVNGNIDNVYFDFYELKILERQILSARLPKMLFHGYFFIFNNNKKVESPLYVRPKLFYDFGKQLFQVDSIELDSSEFNRRFSIYSNEPVEARYILTPAMMARILDFEKKYKHKISLLFRKDKLYIAFKGDNNFLEPALWKKITTNTIIMQVEIFELIAEIVKELNIGNDIWLKDTIMNNNGE